MKYALVSWTDGQMTMRPVEVVHEDISIQVLVALINNGYNGNELAAQYDKIHHEVIEFLHEGANDSATKDSRFASNDARQPRP